LPANTAAAQDPRMLPPPKPPRPKPSKRNAGIYVEQSVLDRAQDITQSENVKSRNELLGSFLTFAVELFPLLKPLRSQIKLVEERHGCTYAEAVARLVEKGLRVKR
jgi:hypothetical protein